MLCVIFRIILPVCFYCSQEKYNAKSGGGVSNPIFANTAKIMWQLPSRAITYAEKAASRAITYAEKAAYTQKDWVFGEKVIETDRDSLISYYIINI